MTVTKAEITELIYKNSDLKKQESASAIESLLEIIKQTLESREDLLISGFGKFCVKGKNKRRGRNPQTGDDMMLDTRRVVTFKCSGVLKEKMNGR